MEIPKGYKQTEIGVIPNDWEERKVSCVFSFLKTNTLSRDKLNYYAGEVMNVHYGDILVKFREILNAAEGGIPYINSDIKFGNNPSYLQSGDIIMADTAEDESVGKSSEIINVSENIVSGLHTIALRPQTDFAPKYLGYFFNSSLYHDQLLPYMQGIKVLSLSKTAVGQTYIISPKNFNEQIVISSCLSDIDDLISILDRQIEKKRQIKEGAMQQLLTGKIRLPGFDQPWVEKDCRDIFTIHKGEQLNVSYLSETAKYPMINGGVEPSGYTNHYNTKGLTITISEGGNSCGFVNFIKQNFWAGGHCYVVEDYSLDKNYLYSLLKFNEPNIMSLRVGSGLPNIQSRSLYEYKLLYSPNSKEQKAIAQILSDMDEEIHQVEADRDKYILIKQGMMQELLTGRTRLR